MISACEVTACKVVQLVQFMAYGAGQRWNESVMKRTARFSGHSASS